MSALIDLTGRRFGRLLVLGREGTYYYDDGFVAVPLWRCRCDCGRETVVQGSCLRRPLLLRRLLAPVVLHEPLSERPEPLQAGG